MKKYIPLPVPERKITHLKVEVYYTLGGMNYFTYKQEPRGYYLSVTPVERAERYGVSTEGFMAFSGTKKLVKPVSRKSEKAFQQAIEMAAAFENGLIRHVCTENGLPLPEGFA